MKGSSLYICYYNVTEPLVQTQVIAYLRELARRDIEIHLLTFEREHHSAERQEHIRSELAESGIIWHSLRYHQRPSLPATLYDIAVGTLTALRICRKNKIRLVHARSHVPAAMALLLKRLTGCQFLFDMRGLMAEEYVDAGNWKEGDLKFRLTKRMERAFFRKAAAFVMLTDRIKRELVSSEPALRSRATDIQVIPCCVDIEKFARDSHKREAYRNERGWTGRRVIVYVGKLGTWYLPEEMARFFRAARGQDSRFFFQVLTQSDPAPMRRALEAVGISPENYNIRFAPQSELPLILNACDASISFRKGEYSKLAASPTKVGECFAAGLPLITNTGIGDCDQILKEHGLGVIIRDYSDAEYQRAAKELIALLEDSGLRKQCRQFADQELSLAKVGGPRYAAVYERLFGNCRLTAASQAAEIA